MSGMGSPQSAGSPDPVSSGALSPASGAVWAAYSAAAALQGAYGALAREGSSRERLDAMVSWRAFNEVLGLEEKFSSEDHFTAVQGPGSDVSERLRVRVKGLMKPVSRQ